MAIDIATLTTADPIKGFLVKGGDGSTQRAPLDADYVKRVSDGKALTTILSEIETAHSALRTTVSNFLTGEATDNDVMDRLTELVAAIQNNKSTIDDLLSDKIDTADIADNLTTNDNTKVLAASQGVAIQTALNGKVAIADIADNLTTNDSTKVLSAKQGKELKDAMDAVKTQVKVITELPDSAAWPSDMAATGVMLYIPAAAAAQSGD